MKKRAEDLGLPFDITYKDIEWVSVCPILEIPLSRGGERFNSPSGDRIIPELGYVKGNVRIISHLANSMKSSANRNQIEMFCKNILKYLDGEV